MKTTWIIAAACCCLGPVAAQAQAPDSTAPAATIAGYVTSSYTATSHNADGQAVGRLFGRQHDQFMLNVADLTIDRPAATDRWDAGVHFEPIFGQNAAVVKSGGLDLGPHADIWQAYVTLNLPVAKDRYFQLKAGKMATLMGLEVFEDVQNPNLDVGTQDIFLEPFTETGVEVDGKFSPAIDAELRITNGWDLVADNNRGKSVMARLGIAADAATTVALLGYTGPEQAGSTSNLRSGGQALFSHQFSGSVTSVAATRLRSGSGRGGQRRDCKVDRRWILGRRRSGSASGPRFPCRYRR